MVQQTVNAFVPRSANLRLSLALLVLFGLLSPAFGHDETPEGPTETIVAAVSTEFAPLYRTESDGTVGGFAVDMFNAVALRAGLPVTYETFETWRDAQAALRNGAVDVIPIMEVKADLRTSVAFTTPLQEFDVVLFKRAGHRSVDGLADLTGRPVGSVATDIGARLLEAHSAVDRRLFATPHMALDALLVGAVDALVAPAPDIWDLARDIRISDRLTVADRPLVTAQRAVAVRKSAQHLLATLDAAVHDYMGTEAYRRAEEKWRGNGTPAFGVAAASWAAVATLLLAVSVLGCWRLTRVGNTISQVFLGGVQGSTERRLRVRGLVLTAVMSGAVAVTAVTTLVLLYSVAFQEQRQRLRETVHSQARLMESVARFNRRHASVFPGGPKAATVHQIREALSRWSGTSEITLARRDDDRIVFLLRQRAWDRYEPAPVPFASDLAEPMRRALNGKSGTVVGPDYRGVMVLAAYEPVAVLDFGVVAKVDMADIRTPFIEAGLTAGAAGTLILLAGALAFVSLGNPLVQQVLERERWFRAIFEQAAVGVALVDSADGRFMRVNQRLCSMVDRNPSDLTTLTLQALVHPIDMPAFLAHMRRLRTGAGHEVHLECRLTGRNRVPVRVDLTVSATREPDQVRSHHIVVVHDITERKRVEEIIDSFFEQPLNLHLIADLDGQVLRVNKGWERHLGYATADMEGRRFLDLLHPDDAQATLADLEALDAGGPPVTFEARFRHKDGTWRVLAWSAIASMEDRTLFAVANDITGQREAERERLRLQAQLQHVQKMEAVGQLSGGIAHDFNNILGIVSGNLELLQRLLVDRPQALTRIETALKGARRGASLTRKLLGFSRNTPRGTVITGVNEFIRGMEELITRSLTPAITVETHLSDALWPVAIDPGDLEDAILNLSLNGRDAMPDGGSLIIETANKVLDADYVARNPGSRPGEHVMIAVGDTGIGIPPELRDKVFEPFFSTKQKGEGAGLGLSMVFGFVRRAGGHITIYSEVGRGTSLHLYLPRADTATADEQNQQHIDGDVPRGHETILVVDDEADLLHIAVSHLERLGYQVLTAGSTDSALQRLDTAKSIDLLFSDVIMPGPLDGYELAARAVDRCPGLKVLLTTGYTPRRETAANGHSRLFAHLARTLLHKPYTATELAFAVRRALDKPLG